jgi:2-keto-4-pentenoate hydratase
MSGLDVEQIAERIVQARARRRSLRPLTDSIPLTMEQAYRIQAAVTGHRVASGQRVVGWKLGYTSQAMREQMGVKEMNFGPLTDVMALPDRAKVPADVVQPLVEPEVAFVMAHELHAPCDVGQVLRATAEVRACLEVVDPIWTDRRFRIEDNTADGSSAAFYVLGEPINPDNLPDVQVTLQHDNATAATATGAAAAGHPANAVTWLATQLAQRGDSLHAGDVVLTGGLTRAIPLEPGHRITAAFFDGRATVDVSVSR